MKLSSYANGVVFFNLMHTSTFFEAFFGTAAGSSLTIHFLARGYENITTKFVKHGIANENEESNLVNPSYRMAEGTVKYVEDLEDHAIVFLEILKMSFLEAKNALRYGGEKDIQLYRADQDRPIRFLSEKWVQLIVFIFRSLVQAHF